MDELGLWDAFWGCFAGSGTSGCIHRRSGAANGGPELGRAGDSVVVDKHIDDDVAVVLGVSERTGVWGASRGGLGCLGVLLDRRLEFLVEQGRSIE